MRTLLHVRLGGLSEYKNTGLTSRTTSEHHVRVPGGRFRGLNQNRVIGMGLDMLLQILRALEGLPASGAFVRLKRNMHSDVRSDVISLDCGGFTIAPLASQVQIICAFATNMSLADMFLGTLVPIKQTVSLDRTHIKSLSAGQLLLTITPITDQSLAGNGTSIHRRSAYSGRGRGSRRSDS